MLTYKENVYNEKLTMVNIKDVAKQAKVSIATVSRALNDNKSVLPETKERILKIAKELNYTPNLIARNLITQKTNVIAFILPEVSGDFFSEIIRGVDEVAFNSNYQLLVASSHSHRNSMETTLKFLERSRVDGIILMLPALSEQMKDILANFRTPVVAINGESEFPAINTVGIDNFQGTYSMISYLINTLGYSKFGLIKGPSFNYDATKRKKGFLEALKDNNVIHNEDWEIEGDFSVNGGELACSRILSLHEKPEVIFACNDMMAAGCYKAINSFDLNIPNDIGVVGFDHVFLSEFITPKLTTVHVPTVDIGREAAKLLFKQINSEEQTSVEHTKISTGIIIGGSTKSQKKNSIH